LGASGGSAATRDREEGTAARAARRRFITAYASIGSMNRWSQYYFWFFYLTPQAVERI
jgi:hypothetical protein